VITTSSIRASEATVRARGDIDDRLAGDMGRVGQRRRGRRFGVLAGLEDDLVSRKAAGAEACLVELVAQLRRAQLTDLERRRDAVQGGGGTRRALGREHCDAAQAGGPQHLLAEIVAVDHVAPRSMRRLQRPDLRIVLELQQRPAGRAVEHEDRALVGLIASRERRRRLVDEVAAHEGFTRHRRRARPRGERRRCQADAARQHETECRHRRRHSPRMPPD
jgi:hypothetical protein